MSFPYIQHLNIVNLNFKEANLAAAEGLAKKYDVEPNLSDEVVFGFFLGFCTYSSSLSLIKFSLVPIRRKLSHYHMLNPRSKS